VDTTVTMVRVATDLESRLDHHCVFPKASN
jgi:hypothetical protein